MVTVGPTTPYVEGNVYAEGHVACPEEDLCRGATPRAALGLAFAEGKRGYAEGRGPSAYNSIPVVI